MENVANSIILLIGLPGSGKTALSKLLQAHGWESVSAGNVIRDLAKDFGSGGSRSDLQEFGKNYLAKYGNEHFALLLANKASVYSKAIIEGVRPIAVISHLAKSVHGIKIVYIDCDSSVRYSRLQDRDGISREEFDLLETHEMEMQVIGAKPLAHIVINNNNSLDNAFYDLINKI